MTVTVLETTSTEACVEAALAWAQEHGYNGDRLPKGQKASHDRCPLACATGMTVDPWEALRFKETDNGALALVEQFGLPPLVKEFVKRFDRGEISEYDLEANDG